MQTKQEFPVLSQIERIPLPSLVVFSEKIRASIPLMIKVANPFSPHQIRKAPLRGSDLQCSMAEDRKFRASNAH